MLAIVYSWLVSAILILGLAALMGYLATGRTTGLLIDGRGRYSLTHLQITLWTLLLLSLIIGTAVGRFLHGRPPLEFGIPGELLAVLGISLGSGVLTTAIKAFKNASWPERVAASMPRNVLNARKLTYEESELWRPRLRQIYMQEEGMFADKVVDIGKFQNLLVTVALALVYVTAVLQALDAAGTAENFTALPSFTGIFLALLAVSHGAYVAVKIPPQSGRPETNLVERDRSVAEATLAKTVRSVPSP